MIYEFEKVMNLKLKFLSKQYRANFVKEDLAFDGYNHTAWPDDDPRLTGKQDSILLNKSESYEMVYFINRYMTAKAWKQKETFQKIEKYLKESKERDKSHYFWRSHLLENFNL